MKIAHISDWHGNLRHLPSADLYVITGDMLPNWQLLHVLREGERKLETIDPSDPRVREQIANGSLRGQVLGRKIDASLESVKQTEWCIQKPFRREVGIPEDVPVVVCRGNHDFIDLADWIGGDVWEVPDNPFSTTEIGGLTIGGCRGIPYIAGEWSDEMPRPDLGSRIRSLPNGLDLLLTHTPPRGILDAGRSHHGVDELTQWLNKNSNSGHPLKAHCFGHVHENYGTEIKGGIMFSNAATTINVFDL